MYITRDEAPAEFMQRYKRIMDGEEKLDTVAKLKEFWLFAVEQGNNCSPEAQLQIANCMMNAAPSSLVYSHPSYKHTYLDIESVADTPYKPNDPYHKNGWSLLVYSVSNLPNK